MAAKHWARAWCQSIHTHTWMWLIAGVHSGSTAAALYFATTTTCWMFCPQQSSSVCCLQPHFSLRAHFREHRRTRILPGCATGKDTDADSSRWNHLSYNPLILMLCTASNKWEAAVMRRDAKSCNSSKHTPKCKSQSCSDFGHWHWNIRACISQR